MQMDPQIVVVNVRACISKHMKCIINNVNIVKEWRMDKQ